MNRVNHEEAEKAILARFIEAYRKRFGIEFANIIHRDKPDFEVSNPKTKERLGIEVTGVYQNSEEAIIQYTTMEEGDIFHGNLDELVESLNVCLEQKTRKSKEYNFEGKMLLAILFGSLVFHEKFDIDFVRQRILIPENRFTEIWLILRDKIDNSPELYLLKGDSL